MKNILIALLITLPTITSNESSADVSFTPVEFNFIKNHISSLIKLNEKKLDQISWSIYKSSQKHQVSHEVMTSIIMVESSFNHHAVSSTGDISIVQINYDIWSKESKRLGWKISKELLKKDPNYAIDCMGKILSHLQVKYAKSDSKWYARYHSKTPSLKTAYADRVQKNMAKNISVAANFE